MSLVEDFETTIKVIVVGNGGVGKSSMIRKFCTGEFTDTYKKTIGVDFLEKEQYINSIGQNITFMVWDTAGQEEFDALTKQYYRNAQGCVIAFSSVDRASFEAVESWKAKVEAEVSDCAMVLVQNKVDLIDKAVASSEEVEELAKRLNLKLYRTCVSENLNVNKVFEYIGEMYVNGGETKVAEPGVPTLAAAPKSKQGANPGGGAAAAADGPAAGTVKAVAAPKAAIKDAKKEGVINVGASQKPKQRTGGKKSFCSIL